MRSVLEWLLALGVLAGVAWIVAPLVLEWLPRVQNQVTLVESDRPAMPRGVPATAQTVPFVMLPDGAVVRVGADQRTLRTALPARMLAGPRLSEDSVFGERYILPYQVDRSRFWVVVERTAPNAEQRVTAIYIQ